MLRSNVAYRRSFEGLSLDSSALYPPMIVSGLILTHTQRALRAEITFEVIIKIRTRMSQQDQIHSCAFFDYHP